MYKADVTVISVPVKPETNEILKKRAADLGCRNKTALAKLILDSYAENLQKQMEEIENNVKNPEDSGDSNNSD